MIGGQAVHLPRKRSVEGRAGDQLHQPAGRKMLPDESNGLSAHPIPARLASTKLCVDGSQCVGKVTS